MRAGRSFRLRLCGQCPDSSTCINGTCVTDCLPGTCSGVCGTARWTVSYVPGSTPGYKNGPAEKARFNGVYQMAIGPNRRLWITEWFNSRVRRIEHDGTVVTVAGDGVFGYKLGKGAGAGFANPSGIAWFAPIKSMVVSHEHRLIKVSADGNVTWFSGNHKSGGSNGSSPAVSSYQTPRAMAALGEFLYMVDVWNHSIRKISSNGGSHHLAGLGKGFRDGKRHYAKFDQPI